MQTTVKILDKTLFPLYNAILIGAIRLGITGMAFNALYWLIGAPIVLEIWKATHDYGR